jgi:DNA-directed RNA polymerase subunit RPC12/RpoP
MAVERRFDIVENQVPGMEVESVQPKTRCPKCGGFIAIDFILCTESNGGWIEDVRCINCGERFFDPKLEILQGRRRTLRNLPKGKE